MRKRRKTLIKWAIPVIFLTLVFGFGTFGRPEAAGTLLAHPSGPVLLITLVLCGVGALYAAFEFVAGKIDERRQDRLQAEVDRKAIARRRERSLKPGRSDQRADGCSIVDDA